MAYRAIPHGSRGYSPYFLLHGREMVLLTTQIVRAKISSKVKGTDYERKARKLKVKPELSLQDGSPEHSKIQ